MEETTSTGGGRGGVPFQEGNRGELTRDEVMAQRADKKKLKEARKNKGDGGGFGTGGYLAGKSKPEVKKMTTLPLPYQATKQSTLDRKKTLTTMKKFEFRQSSEAENKGVNKVTAKKIIPDESTKFKADAVLIPVDKKAQSKQSKSSSKTVVKSKNVSVSVNCGKSSIQSLFFSTAANQVTSEDEIARLHPLFYKFGLNITHNVIRGSNIRCVKLLQAVKEFVRDFVTPPNSEFKCAFSEQFKFNMRLLRKSCPFGIGMTNAVEFLSAYVIKLGTEYMGVNTQKQYIMDSIDTYIEEKIEKGVEAIVLYTVQKLTSGDVIMTYSITEAVVQVFIAAAKQGVTFSIIFVVSPDTMPDMQILLEALAEPIKKNQVTISTVNFSNAIHRIRHCSKVLIGGHGLFTTGGVMALCGSGELALLASTYNTPRIFLCETYKFCDRSPLDYFSLDEYMHALSLNEDGIFEPKIRFDITPADLVTVVITDIDVLPSTSVPGVLRVQETRKVKGDPERTFW